MTCYEQYVWHVQCHNAMKQSALHYRRPDNAKLCPPETSFFIVPNLSVGNHQTAVFIEMKPNIKIFPADQIQVRISRIRILVLSQVYCESSVFAEICSCFLCSGYHCLCEHHLNDLFCMITLLMKAHRLNRLMLFIFSGLVAHCYRTKHSKSVCIIVSVNRSVI